MEKKIDNRRYRRVPFRRSIKFRAKGHEIFLSHLAQDISQGGIRCSSSEFMALHTEVVAHLQLREYEKIIELQGRVKWVRSGPNSDSYQLGIEFFGDNEYQRSIIAKFVETI
jgi:c-di-GMP-binding flagellar brake protein YcgR